MDNVIKPWVELWDYLDGNFWHLWQWANQSLPPEAVGWQPIPEVASIGWNLHHLGEMLDYYLAHVFGRGEPVQQTPLLTMRAGSQDDGRHRDLRAIAAYHQQVRPAYREFLAGLRAGELDHVIERQGKRAITFAWAIGQFLFSPHCSIWFRVELPLRHRAESGGARPPVCVASGDGGSCQVASA